MGRQVAEALRAAARDLAGAGVENGAAEAAWLLAHVLGVSVSQLRLRPDRVLTAAEEAAFSAVVARRLRREPLQYILGTQEFLGLEFRVTPDVLIPRPETEVLVRELARRLAEPERRLVLADIGTGSGCIAAGLCHLLPGAEVHAVDISPGALKVAAENARRLGYGQRIRWYLGDLYDPLPPGLRFDAIAANPPYVAEDELPGLMPEVRDWEPRVALTPGPDPLSLIRRLVAAAPERLRPGGYLGLEVGYNQAAAVQALMAAHGFAPEAVADDAGHLRCVIGRWTGAAAAAGRAG